MAESAIAIVIDTNVACARAGTEAEEARRKWSFLMGVDQHGHDVAADERLVDEWYRDASRDARVWLVRMRQSGRLRPVKPLKLREIDRAVKRLAKDLGAQAAGVPAIIEKDRHLAEIALAADRRVASCEKDCWRWFGQLSRYWPRLTQIAWVNPLVDDTLDAWLATGCPLEPHRMLRA